MAVKPGDLNDEQLVYGYLAEYLDDNLDASIQAPYREALSKVDKSGDLAQRFSESRGRFQIDLQEFFLDEQQIHDLHVLVEDDATRATNEAHEIQHAGSVEFYGNMGRRIGLIALLAAVIIGGVYYLSPPTKAPFNALETLVHEARIMEEDPDGRLDLPSASINELQEYISNYPQLGFSPAKLASFQSEWEPEGASVIDYEVAKIAVVQYGKPEQIEKLFLFMFKGNLSQLPKAETGNHKGLVYQTYASDKINVIAWQISEGVVGMMVGHRGALELAELAQNGVRS